MPRASDFARTGPSVRASDFAPAGSAKKKDSGGLHFPNPIEAVKDAGGSALGFTLRQVSRPVQAVESALGEISREGEKDPINLGPVHLRFGFSPGKVWKATEEGFQHKRSDTPLSISREAGEERARQGGPVGAFGLPGSDLRTNPLGAPKPLQGASNFVFDVGAGAGLDPLTYLTFGASAVAKSAAAKAAGVLAAERAGVLAEGGLKALTTAERAKLAEALTPAQMRALGTVRGGIGVRTPSMAALREGKLLGEGRTLVPGETVARAFRPMTAPIERLGETGIARGAARVFQPRAAVAQELGRNVAEKMNDARVRYAGGFHGAVEDDVNRILAASKQAGVTDDELQNIVGPALDIGGAREMVPEHLHPVYDALDEVRHRVTNLKLEHGLVNEGGLIDTEQYLPRVLTEEAKADRQGARKIATIGEHRPRLSGTDDPFQAHRTVMPESSARDVNAALRGKLGYDLFDPNPVKAMVERSISGHRAVATKRYVDDLAAMTDDAGNRLVYSMDEIRHPTGGEAGRVFDQGADALPAGYDELNLPGVGKFAADPAIAREVKRSFALLTKDDELSKFVRGLDKWQSLWKSYATVPFVFGLGFHERNALGNVTNNWLAGISPADGAYGQAMKLQRLARRGAKDGDVRRFMSDAQRATYEEARRYGVIGEGFFDVDLPTNVGERAARGGRASTVAGKAKRVGKASNPFSQENVVIRAGRRLGGAIEQNARLAHFIAKQRELGDAAEAARSVRKYLFDYGDLTAVEQQAFRRLIPFYTFSRKNLPVQIEAVLRTPGKFSRLQLARIGLADQAQTPEGEYPEYLPGIGGTPLPAGVVRALSPFGFGANDQLALAPDLPAVNASEVITPAYSLLARAPIFGKALPDAQEPGQALLDLAGQVSGGAPGLARSALEAGLHRQAFLGRSLEGEDPAPVYAEPFVRREDGTPIMARSSRHVLEDTVPFLQRFATIFPRGDYEKGAAPRRRLSATTGVRVYNTSKEKGKPGARTSRGRNR